MSTWNKAMLGRRYWSPAVNVAAVEDLLGSRRVEDLAYEARDPWMMALRYARVSDWLNQRGQECGDALGLMHDAMDQFNAADDHYADPFEDLRGWR